MATTILSGLYKVYIGILEDNLATTILLGLYRVYIGMMQNKMETVGVVSGLYRGHSLLKVTATT